MNVKNLALGVYLILLSFPSHGTLTEEWVANEDASRWIVKNNILDFNTDGEPLFSPGVYTIELNGVTTLPLRRVRITYYYNIFTFLIRINEEDLSLTETILEQNVGEKLTRDMYFLNKEADPQEFLDCFRDSHLMPSKIYDELTTFFSLHKQTPKTVMPEIHEVHKQPPKAVMPEIHEALFQRLVPNHQERLPEVLLYDTSSDEDDYAREVIDANNFRWTVKNTLLKITEDKKLEFFILGKFIVTSIDPELPIIEICVDRNERGLQFSIGFNKNNMNLVEFKKENMNATAVDFLIHCHDFDLIPSEIFEELVALLYYDKYAFRQISLLKKRIEDNSYIGISDVDTRQDMKDATAYIAALYREIQNYKLGTHRSAGWCRSAIEHKLKIH